MYLELLATLAIAATHQSQLGQDFEIYASQEFGLVELSDAWSRERADAAEEESLRARRDTQAGQAAGDVARARRLHTGSARTDHFHLLNAPFHERSTRRSRSPG